MEEVIKYVKERLKKEIEEGKIKDVKIFERGVGKFLGLGIDKMVFGEEGLMKKIDAVEREVMMKFAGKIAGVARIYV